MLAVSTDIGTNNSRYEHAVATFCLVVCLFAGALRVFFAPLRQICMEFYDESYLFPDSFWLTSLAGVLQKLQRSE